MNKKLTKKLLAIGGSEISQQPCPYITRVTAMGRPWPIKGRMFVEGIPGKCHENTARWWLHNQHSDIVTGYVLAWGQWIVHNWLSDEGRVVETTHPFAAYFGVECTKNESRLFCLAEFGKAAEPLVIAGLRSTRDRLSFLRAINERKPEKSKFVRVFV